MEIPDASLTFGFVALTNTSPTFHSSHKEAKLYWNPGLFQVRTTTNHGYALMNDASPQTMIGQVVGKHYQILELIGTSGLSRSYRALHTSLNKQFTLKWISPNIVYDERSTQRFRQIAHAAAGLKHENICQTDEFGIDEAGRCLVVTEYLEGQTLKDLLIRLGRPARSQMLAIVIPFCRGLSYAHGQGMIHGDIKPDNIRIMVESDDSIAVKVSDFGMASLLNPDDGSSPDLIKTCEILGTPDYMSPEQGFGKPQDHRSDIYSVGCILYELTSGVPPFQNYGRTDGVVLAHMTEAPPPLPAQLPAKLQQIIGRCLKKKPDERYQNMQQLLSELEEYQSARVRTEPAPSVPNEPRQTLVDQYQPSQVPVQTSNEHYPPQQNQLPPSVKTQHLVARDPLKSPSAEQLDQFPPSQPPGSVQPKQGQPQPPPPTNHFQQLSTPIDQPLSPPPPTTTELNSPPSRLQPTTQTHHKQYHDFSEQEAAQSEFVGVIGERYEILEVVAQGGMGTVLRARHLVLNKPVAIKVLNPGRALDDHLIQRFEQEAKAGSNLSHPHLVSVFDYGFTANREPYLVMEYVEGQSLYEILAERGRMSAAEFLDVFSQACKAVQYLHNNNVIHRDLKPSNIVVQMIDGDRYVKLLDLGIAKVLTEENRDAKKLTTTGQIFGSPTYMSPEQCKGQEAERQSDIYSLGCVMYECIAGCPPMVGENIMHVIYQHINEAPPDLVTLIKADREETKIAAVIQKCLQKSPKDRYQNAGEILAILNEIASGSAQPNLPATQVVGLLFGKDTRNANPESSRFVKEAAAKRSAPVDESPGRSPSSGSSPSAGGEAGWKPAVPVKQPFLPQEHSAASPTPDPRSGPSPNSGPGFNPENNQSGRETESEQTVVPGRSIKSDIKETLQRHPLRWGLTALLVMAIIVIPSVAVLPLLFPSTPKESNESAERKDRTQNQTSETDDSEHVSEKFDEDKEVGSNSMLGALKRAEKTYSLGKDHYLEAKSQFEEALEFSDDFEDTQAIGLINARLGEIDFENKSYINAQSRFEKAVELLQPVKSDNKDYYLDSLVGLAHVENKQKAYVRAESHLSEARKLASDWSMPDMQADILLASAKNASHDKNETALFFYDGAIKAFNKLKNPSADKIAMCYLGAVEVCDKMGKQSEAQKRIGLAVALSGKVKSPQLRDRIKIRADATTIETDATAIDDSPDLWADSSTPSKKPSSKDPSFLAADVTGCIMQVYISTDDHEPGQYLGSHSWYGGKGNNLNFTTRVIPGKRNYIHVVLQPPNNDRVWVGYFRLSGGTAKFAANGMRVLDTRPDYWKVSRTYWGRDYHKPTIAPGEDHYTRQDSVLARIHPNCRALMDPEGGLGYKGNLYYTAVINPR
ncbi:MAG: protein kinase [Candidatus Obscuribacterales bacterium]|nr:protein kinase [Candidatus Obscuribacterales bacterium]